MNLFSPLRYNLSQENKSLHFNFCMIKFTVIPKKAIWQNWCFGQFHCSKIEKETLSLSQDLWWEVKSERIHFAESSRPSPFSVLQDYFVNKGMYKKYSENLGQHICHMNLKGQFDPNVKVNHWIYIDNFLYWGKN